MILNKPVINLQDGFLNQVRKESVPVTIYLANGFQLRGLVRGFDNFTIILDSEGKPELVYKHAISTIIPARPLREFSGEPGLSKEPKLDEV
jgi:host factor-I protein